jgi:Mediator complex subunit Med5
MAFSYRYNLHPSQLGDSAPDSFVKAHLRRHSAPVPLDELNPRAKTALSEWIAALFGEEPIIGDELLSKCPPSVFYEIVPTLFKQFLRARKAGLLDQEKLGNGMECKCILLFLKV